MTTPDHLSYDVRIWNIVVYKGKRATTYTVRWLVAGKKWPETFATRKLAESFRSKLLTAAREGVPFDTRSGLPISMARDLNSPSWYELACKFVDMKWPHASARQRKSIAESLATVTPALLATDRGAPEPELLRRTLYGWSFNKTARGAEPAPDVSRTAKWVAANTVKVSDIMDAEVIRRALDALALTLNGKAAAPNTIARKRAVFYGVLRYAVELKLLTANPIDTVQWKTPRNTDEVDRRVVVNHGQARALLTAVGEVAPALEAFFACMYYAGMRPAEVIHLRAVDVALPPDPEELRRKGRCVPPDLETWGELLLTGSTGYAGAWGESGESREDRALKHRADKDTRPVPICPDLVRILRTHLATFDTGPDGRLFVTRVGKFGRPIAGSGASPVTPSAYLRVWHKAREKALTAAEAASPLAARPYDLRHAAVSTWLNAGVPAPQVAEWAGHSVAVLLRVYAKCIYGEVQAARRRIEAALQIEDDSLNSSERAA